MPFIIKDLYETHIPKSRSIHRTAVQRGGAAAINLHGNSIRACKCVIRQFKVQ